MKIKGRFLAVLAAVGLLIALLPALPTGAVAGEISLKNGSKAATHFSDNSGYNVVSIEVKDTDLSATRIGKARWATDSAVAGFVDVPSGSSFDVGDSIVGGEKSKTDKFHGAASNQPCFTDGDLTGTATRPTDTGDGTTGSSTPNGQIDPIEAAAVYETGTWDDPNDDPDAGATLVHSNCTDAAAAAGDALEGAGSDGDFDATDDNTYTFRLSQVVRDANDDGMVDLDDITVTVNGVEVADASITLQSSTDYTGDTRASSTNGGGSSHVMITGVTPEAEADSVEIEYEYSEYDFAMPATTPLNRDASEIHYGELGTADASNRFADADSDLLVVGTQVAAATLNAAVALPTSPSPTALVVTFAYDVKDTISDNVIVSSEASVAENINLELDGVETGAGTNVFMSTVVLFSADDYRAIETAQGLDTVTNVEDLQNAMNAGGDNIISEDLWTRIRDDAVGTNGLALGDNIDDLLAMSLQVRHGNQITVRYSDDGASTRTKSATADLEGPSVTLISPQGSYLRDGLVTLSATVQDDDAGINEGDVTLTPTSVTDVNLNDPTTVPVLDGQAIVGYTVSATAATALEEGPHSWYVNVMDKVGNTPESDTKGGSTGNPFKFNIDTAGPQLRRTGVAGETGVTLKNPGITSGDNEEEEVANAEWLRLDLDLGNGDAPLDPTSVQASDFRVGGAEPLNALVNSVAHGTMTNPIPKGSAIYLEVGPMDTDARPTVTLTGEIADQAGNLRTSGTATAIVDGIAPELDVTLSAELSDTEVVITVVASEALQFDPEVRLSTAHPAGDNTAGATISTTRIVGAASPTWTATRKVSNGEVGLLYVIANATDRRENDASVGKGSASDNKKDIITFEVDDKAPTVKFIDSSGNLLTEEDPEEGAVWIIAEFDEDEYAGDTNRKVTVTAATLTASDGTVISDDAAALFSGENNPCQADGSTGRCATHTLAVNLDPGSYTIEVTGVDAIGNSVTDDATFEVTQKEPFELQLNPGVNLVSIPGSPVGDGGNLNVLFEDLDAVTVVTTYNRMLDVSGQNPWQRSSRDPETGLFTGDISTLEPGVSYFITSDARVTAEVTIESLVGQLPPTIQALYGYNAIGFWSISGEASTDMDDYLSGITWTAAYWYDPTPGQGWQVIRPGGDEMAMEGRGYLVLVRFDGTGAPS